jgi:hypothetical protein
MGPGMGPAMAMTASHCRFDAGGLLKDRWLFNFVRQLFAHYGLALEEIRRFESDLGGTDPDHS